MFNTSIIGRRTYYKVQLNSGAGSNPASCNILNFPFGWGQNDSVRSGEEWLPPLFLFFFKKPLTTLSKDIIFVI